MLRDTVRTPIVLNGQPANSMSLDAVYRCRLLPEQLTATGHPDIRFCAQCQQKVFTITDFEGLEKAVASKGCVWVPADTQGDGQAAPTIFGLAEFSSYDPGPPLEWAD